MPRSTKTTTVQVDFPFYAHLRDFYVEHRSTIKRNYKELTQKYLSFNDPSNPTAFLRRPQFEALEMYIFLKEFLENQPIHQLFQQWANKTGRFAERAPAVINWLGEGRSQRGLFDESWEEQLQPVYNHMRSYARIYPNYIFALTMGTGKTILMATCIFYEFILANKYPKDPRYCQNALVFAPDTTVLQSLREIQTFDKSLVVPPEYVRWLDANMRIHFLDEAGMTLNTLDQSRYNLIISNTQKVILKRQHKEKSPMEMLMSSRPTYEPGSVYAELGDLLTAGNGLDSEEALTSNQRFQKLQRLAQLGIFVDEAHHAFGTKLAEDMGPSSAKKTSLRLTIDELAASLKRAGTHIVACYNYTGTPYVQNTILPEVVYAFSLSEAIQKEYLKMVRTHGYNNTQTTEFVEATISNFLSNIDITKRHEGMLPKMAFFAATVEELQNELYPAVEAVLIRHHISTHSILINVGDEKLTSNQQIREFNRLDTSESEKQFILLVNKGREGWNCRSLFAVALFRKPKSKIFVLQASMRCLRSIGSTQQTGHVYLSSENLQILDDELQQNFRTTIQKLEEAGQGQREVIEVQVKTPVEKITLTRVQRLYRLREKPLPLQIDLNISEAPTERYRMLHTERAGFYASGKTTEEDISDIRKRRQFSKLTLVAEIARYLNKPCLEIEEILSRVTEGVENLLTRINEFNELLYDWIIPRLFERLYEMKPYESREEYEVDLVKVPAQGYYEVTSRSDRIVRERDATIRSGGMLRESGETYNGGKSFHLDTYCFDSEPEQLFFWDMLRDRRIRKVYFTGMLTHGQSDFYVQYIDPESHTIRSYYPDFLLQMENGEYIIVEIKGDNKTDDPIVKAKQAFAEQMAVASNMRYVFLPQSKVTAKNYDDIWTSPSQHRMGFR